MLQLRCAKVNQDLCITVSTNKLHNEDLEEGEREKQKSILPPHQNLCDSSIYDWSIHNKLCNTAERKKQAYKLNIYHACHVATGILVNSCK